MSDPHQEPPLSGVRVIDATRGIPGYIATMLLADLGAQVIRLSSPREHPELPGEVMWHRNKTIIDPASASSLVARADLIVESETQVGDAPALAGFDSSSTEVAQVRLCIPAWEPQSGLDPLTADRFAQAAYGIARRQTSFSGGPVDSVYPFTSYLQGVWGAAAAIAALIERNRSGRGQTVTVDSFHGAIVTANTTMFTDPTASLPTTKVGPGGPNPAFGTYRCADGEWIFLGALGVKFQDIAFELLGVEDIIDDELAANRELIYSVERRDGIRARIAAGFIKKSRAEWLDLLADAGCPAAPVASRDEWLDHPQAIALGQRVEMNDPIVGLTITPGLPIRLSSYSQPVFAPRKFAKECEWTAIAGDLTTASQIETTQSNASEPLPGRGPLHGIRIVDLGTVLAGPYAGLLLAALGADVIRLETLAGDEFRIRGHMTHRGLRAISLDLRQERGYQAFLKLVSQSEAVLDNFRPGVLERLRIDHETLRSVRDDIVTTSITGYGGVGPIGSLPGYDPVMQALTGVMKAMGGDAEPVFSTVAINDVGVATLAVLGTCAGLYQQSVGRGGMRVETSLAEAATFVQSNELVRFEGRVPAERGGRDFPGPNALSRYYACADGWVRTHFPSLEAAVRTGLVPAGVTGEEELVDALAAAIAPLSASDVLGRIRAQGGSVQKARDNKDVLFDSASIRDGYVGRVVWPDGEETYMPREYARFSLHQRSEMMTAPGHGEHTREVLAEAGLDAEEIDALLKERAAFQGVPIPSIAGTGYR